MEGLDLHSQLLLDISQFNKQLNRSVRQYKKAMKQMGVATKVSTAAVNKAMGKEEKHLKKSGKAVDKNAASWWKRFGAVALGFTIAYRAMNAFENGLTRVVQLIGDSIRVSGELASVQAKLAFWYQLHSKQVGNFNELYARAGVNTMALMRANLGAISTFEELATGIDEVAQSIGGVGPEWIKHLASVVDFTKLVAQTTGSTTRQIRQELQALMQGQIKTTDVMVRSLVRVGILMEEDIADLKKMTRQTEIFHHILTEIHGRWTEVAGIIIATNVEIAMQKWEDHLKFMLLIGTKIASEYEGVGNIFAQVFVDHMKKIRENMTHKDWTNMVRFILNLKKALNFLLNVFEKTLDIIIKVVASFGKFSETAGTVAQFIKYGVILLMLSKVFSILGKMVGQAITKFAAFYVLVKGKAAWSFATLGASISLLVGKIFAIVAGIAAVGVALKTLWDMSFNINKEAKAEYDKRMQELMEGPKKLLEAGEITWAKFLDHLAAAQQEAAKGIKFKGFFEVYADNIGGGLAWLGEIVSTGIKTIWDTLVDVPELKEEDIQKIVNEVMGLTEGVLEGLGSIADPMAKVGEKAFDKYIKSLTLLKDEYQSYHDTLVALKTGELWWKDSKAVQEYQDEISATNKLIRQHAILQQELAPLGKEAAKLMADSWLTLALNAREARIEQEKYLRNQKMMEELQNSLFELTHTAHEVQMEMLRLEVENMRKTEGITKELKDLIDAYYEMRMLQIERDFNHMNELATRTAESMEASFSDLFFDVITGDFEDLEDLVTRVLQNIQRILSDVLAQMLRVKLFGTQIGTGESVGGILPGIFGAKPKVPYIPAIHSGGTAGMTFSRSPQVPDWFSTFAPRLHNGLRSDEYPAILQAGERVIKRGGNDDKVNIQINNYTGAETQVKEDRSPYGGRDITVVIGEALGKDVSQGGALHQSLRRTFGLVPVTAGR